MADARELARAVWVGDLAAVEALIAAGVDVNASDEDGRQPPLHLAIEQQRVDIARRLIVAGAAVNRDLGEGWTPLAHAIDIESDAASQRYSEPGRADTDVTEMLLNAGAIPTERAFDLAQAYGNERALALLRRHATGADSRQGP